MSASVTFDVDFDHGYFSDAVILFIGQLTSLMWESEEGKGVQTLQSQYLQTVTP